MKSFTAILNGTILALSWWRSLLETSPLLCSANQWVGFYTTETSIMKELNVYVALATPMVFRIFQKTFFVKQSWTTASGLYRQFYTSLCSQEGIISSKVEVLDNCFKQWCKYRNLISCTSPKRFHRVFLSHNIDYVKCNEIFDLQLCWFWYMRKMSIRK